MPNHTEEKDYFEKIYYKTCYSVRRYLRSRCDSYQDTEDVMQETYYEVFLQTERIKASGNPEGYVMNVAKNKYMKYRAVKRKREAEEEKRKRTWEEAVFEDTVGDTMEMWEFVKEHLSPKDYQIVRLRYDNLDSFKVIAEKLNTTEAACKMRLKRSLKKLEKVREKGSIGNS